MSLPKNKVKEIIDKHSRLEKELSSTELDSKSYAQKSKEYSSLSDIIKYAQDYSNFEENKKELEKMVLDGHNDQELKVLAKSELDNENADLMSLIQ